jgi:hypothetical protein
LNIKKNQIPKINPCEIQISVKRIYKNDFNTLEKLWLALEEISSTSFFLSWKWIGCWLRTTACDQKLYLVEAKKNSTIIGLGVFVEQNIVRHNFIPSKQWHLHRTGIENRDQIWIENNGFLLSNLGKNEIHNAIWQHLLSNQNSVDEFIIYLANKSSFTNLVVTNRKYNRINELFEYGYKIPLGGLSSLQSYLSGLSKNTRQQFNRSIKHITKQGNIEFTVIEESQDQIEVIDNTKHWHITKWHSTSTPSGFENKEFCKFHNQLLKNSHPSASTLMATLKINQEFIGCIYCFSHQNSVYFYLSCLKPFSDNKIKLGLIMHVFMVEWLISNKKRYIEYDFMAGDARYKSSLSTVKDQYLKLTLQRNAIKFVVEKQLKKAYKAIIK